jgi:signal peptidase II
MMWTRARLALFALVMATVGCDRVTKHVAATTLSQAPMQSFMRDTVRLEYAENTGGFLSLGARWPANVRTGLFTIGNAIVLLAAVLAAARGRWSGSALAGTALIVAGGASNLADRIVRGSVIDFVNVGIGPFRTGIFNIADVAIMLGGALVAFGMLRRGETAAPHR